jgi:DNA damage-binding protein 1
VEILSLESNDAYMTTLCAAEALSALPRSVSLYNFGNHPPGGPDFHPYLLAGLADGTLVSFAMKDNSLSDKKVISLGDAPVCLAACEVENRRAVFACGSRAAAIFWDKDRLQYPAVLLKVSVMVFFPIRSGNGIGNIFRMPLLPRD